MQVRLVALVVPVVQDRLVVPLENLEIRQGVVAVEVFSQDLFGQYQELKMFLHKF